MYLHPAIFSYSYTPLHCLHRKTAICEIFAVDGTIETMVRDVDKTFFSSFIRY